MKIVKKLLKVLMWTLIVVAALVVLLPLWFGPVVRLVANTVTPKITGTDFNLGVLSLNQYNGKFTLGDMQLFNPADFKDKIAVSLGEVHVNADMGTVASSTIVIEDVRIHDVFVAYVSNDKGETNFEVIQRNVGGGKEKPKAEEQPAPKEEPKTEKQPAEEKPAKKFIVDHLVIDGVKLQVGSFTAPLAPKIELNGIGRDSGGASWEEIWNQVTTSIMSSLGDAGKMLTDMGSAMTEATMKHVDNLSKAGMQQMDELTKASQKHVDSMSEAFKGGADIVGESAGKTMDTVSESASKAADAVGESATKAVDAIKNLF